MRTRILFFIMSVILYGSSLNAQNVAWCTKSVTSDAGYITLLTNAGYTVTSTEFEWSNLDAAGAADLNNNYDLVIISKVNNSGEFTNTTDWQSISTPVLNMFDYGARSSRLKYFNSTAVTNAGGTQMIASDPTHALFNGITLDGSNITGALLTKFETIAESSAGNGTILATDNAGTGYVLAAEWDAGTEFYSGSGAPAGKRMFLASDYGYSYVGDGDQLFLNAVGYLAPLTPTINLSNSSVEEGLGANTGTFVGRLSTANITGAVLSIYNDGTNDIDNAMFTVSGDTLYTVDSLDYEAQASYTITIRATGTPTTDKEFTITVLNINELSAPITDITIDNATIAENEAPGTIVGTLTAVDTNAFETHTFTLVTGNGTNDADNSKFQINGSDLELAEALDYETQSSFSILVKADDGNHNTFEKSFTITATNQGTGINLISNGTFDSSIDGWSNNSSGNGSISWENGELEYAISDVGTNTYSVQFFYWDIFFLEGHKYAISFDIRSTEADYDIIVVAGENGGSYANLSDGVAYTASTTTSNYTDTIDVNATYSDYRFGIQAGAINANAAPDTLYIDNISIIDISERNSTPEDLQLSATAVLEHATSVGIISATDPDEGETLSYSFATGSGDTDNALFEIANGNELNLLSGAVYGATYNVRLKATDDSSAVVEETFAITVTNVNDAPTDISLTSTSIDENSADNSEVGTLSATDPDAGDALTFTFIAGDGSNDSDNDAFSITGESLSLNVSPDFEIKASYNIYVQVEDFGGLTFSKAFTIIVNDLNETPTSLTLSSNTLPEESPIGQFIGTLSATDNDTGDILSYALIAGNGTNDANNSMFNIIGNELVSAVDGLDYETTPDAEYNIFIQVTDNGGLSTTLAEVVTLTDINEANQAPTDISLSENTISENAALNNVIGILSTTDGDAGDIHNYRFIAGTGDDDNASFIIDGDSIKLNTSLDFETKSSYTILVETDDQSLGIYSESFIITVTDINEAPVSLILSNSSVDEELAGELVGILIGTDQDAGSTLSYSLVAGIGDDNNALFTIVDDSLKTASALDYETLSALSICVEVSDGSLTYTTSLAISVNDIFENSAPSDIVLSANTVSEDAALNTVIGTLTATDADASDSHTFSLVSGTGDDDNASFIINGDALELNAALDYETKSALSVRIEVSDGTATFATAMSITVTDAVETATNAIELSNLEVYPNPFTDKLYISGLNGSSATISIINITGQAIYSNEFMTNEIIEIQLDGLKSGGYMVCVKTADKTIVKQVISE